MSKKVIHTDDREKELQLLVTGVLNASVNSWYNPNGADESTCPFCSSTVYFAQAEMNEIKHRNNCAYLIAKDLVTT